MNHFLDIKALSAQSALELIQRAMSFKNTSVYPLYPKVKVANLFYENSTRTRVSFELAAKNLGMQVINFDKLASSESKGEIIEDTMQTLAAMGIQLFVIRHVQERLPEMLAQQCGGNIHIINAGDGTHAHPSQAMLDFMTIMEKHPDLSKIKLAVVGNIRHSRVANSIQSLSALLNVGDVAWVAPELWQPNDVEYGKVTSSLQEGIADADVVICLRVQRERLLEDEHLDLASYRQNYALTRESLAQAKPGVMIMHPGPMNRGVEIDSDIADGAQSYILRQVNNGVFMRMAILEKIALSVSQ